MTQAHSIVRRLVSLVIGAALLAALAWVGKGFVSPRAAATKPPRGPALFPVAVEVARIATTVATIDTYGELVADEEVVVSAEVAGIVSSISFREGDATGRASVLALVDPTRYALAVQRAEAVLTRSEADLDEKAASLKRRLELRKQGQGWVSDEEVHQFEAQVAQGRAAVLEARASLELAREDLRRSVVRSPFVGMVEKKLANEGQFVQPGTGIAWLVRTDPLRLRFSLREEDAGRVRLGSPVRFTTAAHPGRVFTASVVFVGRTADAKTRRVEVLASVPNADEALRAGFFATVRVELAPREGVIYLPETAVLPTERGLLAFVVRAREDKKPPVAVRRQVVAGAVTSTGHVEVLRGIEPGETVVVRGAAALEDGVPLKVEPNEPVRGKGDQAP